MRDFSIKNAVVKTLQMGKLEQGHRNNICAAQIKNMGNRINTEWL